MMQSTSNRSLGTAHKMSVDVGFMDDDTYRQREGRTYNSLVSG